MKTLVMAVLLCFAGFAFGQPGAITDEMSKTVVLDDAPTSEGEFQQRMSEQFGQGISAEDEEESLGENAGEATQMNVPSDG